MSVLYAAWAVENSPSHLFIGPLIDGHPQDVMRDVFETILHHDEVEGAFDYGFLDVARVFVSLYTDEDGFFEYARYDINDHLEVQAYRDSFGKRESDRRNALRRFARAVDAILTCAHFHDYYIDTGRKIGICEEALLWQEEGGAVSADDDLRRFARAVEAIALCALIREEGIRDACDLLNYGCPLEADWLEEQLVRRPLPPRGEGGAG